MSLSLPSLESVLRSLRPPLWRANQTSKYLLKINYQCKRFFSRSPKSVISFYSKQASFIQGSSACANTSAIFSTRRLKRETKDIFRSPTDETRKAKACATVLGRCRIFECKISKINSDKGSLSPSLVACLLRGWTNRIENYFGWTRRRAKNNNFWREHRDEKAKLDLLPFRRLSFVRCKIHFTFYMFTNP